MYGLPKIHKTGIPLRPILSMCHSAKHSLAKWVVDVLDPVLDFYSVCCVMESFTFSSIIRRQPVCMESQFLVSLDAVFLFTNIPLDETISICADFLYRCPSVASLPFPEAVFIELMGIATRSVSFSFRQIEVIYKALCFEVAQVQMNGAPNETFVKLRALLWDPLWVPFWRIFLLGSMKEVCLISFLSPLLICDMWMTLSLPSNLVALL